MAFYINAEDLGVDPLTKCSNSCSRHQSRVLNEHMKPPIFCNSCFLSKSFSQLFDGMVLCLIHIQALYFFVLVRLVSPSMGSVQELEIYPNRDLTNKKNEN